LPEQKQKKMETTADELPCWIKDSDFVKQFIVDFPDDKLNIDVDRNFDFPHTLNQLNIHAVLDNLRYFGIKDVVYFDKITIYCVKRNNDCVSYVEELKSTYSEFVELWKSVLFIHAYSNGSMLASGRR
jgi:hypothetical protein